MTGPHLTPEREAEIRARTRTSLSITSYAAEELLAALDAEREAHQQTRTALEDSTALLAEEQWHARREGRLESARRIDLRIQANQTVLGLAVAEADKPHDGNER